MYMVRQLRRGGRFVEEKSGMKPVAVVIGCVLTLLAATDAGAFAASASLIALAAVSEPSGLLALVLVMITLGVGVVMRLAHEVRVLIVRYGQRRIDLDRVRRWWIDQRRPAR
jgi:hypothetical protein